MNRSLIVGIATTLVAGCAGTTPEDAALDVRSDQVVVARDAILSGAVVRKPYEWSKNARTLTLFVMPGRGFRDSSDAESEIVYRGGFDRFRESIGHGNLALWFTDARRPSKPDRNAGKEIAAILSVSKKNLDMDPSKGPYLIYLRPKNGFTFTLETQNTGDQLITLASFDDVRLALSRDQLEVVALDLGYCTAEQADAKLAHLAEYVRSGGQAVGRPHTVLESCRFDAFVSGAVETTGTVADWVRKSCRLSAGLIGVRPLAWVTCEEQE